MGKTFQKSGFRVIALTAELVDVPEEIQLLPYGYVKSTEGDFIVDEISIKEIKENLGKRKNDTVIDYEHQTIYGGEAPAAGWFNVNDLIDKGKVGLWVKPRWTPRAEQYIKNKEYRYFSPVVLVRLSDMRAINIHSGALTNTPAIDGMVPIINKNLTGFIPEEMEVKEEMIIKALKQLLGLKDDATDQEVLDAVTQLNSASKLVANKEILQVLGLDEKATLEQVKEKITPVNLVANKEILEALGLDEKATVAEVKGKIIALKNPANYVSSEEFKALKEKLDKKEVDEVVQLALSQGKITPAQKDWAESMAKKDMEGFKQFLNTAPVVVPLSQIKVNKDTKVTIDDETTLMINKQLGIDPELYKKYEKELNGDATN
jgi:phage I-like protein